MWWLKPIYTVMPFVYMIAGGASIASSESTVGIVSGTLLISAGIVILQMRRDYKDQLSSAGMTKSQRS